MIPTQTTHDTTREVPEETSPNRLKVDADGRALPRTDAERAGDVVRIRAMLARMAEIPDDDGVSDAEIFRAIDAERPHRPLFEGMY